MNKLKTSRYNLLFQIDNDNFLLINEFKGSMNLVDNSLVPFLTDEVFENREELRETIVKLIDSGYLLEDSEDRFMHEAEQKCLLARRHLQGIFHVIVTYNCNMNCIYCYEKKLKERGRRWLKKKLAKRQVDKIFDAMSQIDNEYNLGKSKIALTGGEPLLTENYEIIRYILKSANDYSYDCGIVTNGVKLKNFLPILNKFGVRSIQVTIDGPKQIHDQMRFLSNGSGTFDIIVEGIDALLDTNIQTIMRVNLNHLNIKYLPEFLRLVQSKGWFDHQNFRCDFKKTFGDQCNLSWKRFAEEMSSIAAFCPPDIFKTALLSGLDAIIRKAIGRYKGTVIPKFFGCYACGKLYIFDPHGHIYTCVRAIGDKKLAVGTFFPRLDIWQALHKWRNRTIFNIPKCRSCKYAFMCGGGCGFRAYTKTGDIMTPECDEFYDFKNHFLSLVFDYFKDSILTQTPRIRMFKET